MVINAKVVASEFLPFLRAYKDGTVERFLDSPYVPSSPDGLTTEVLSKDIVISPVLLARIYLPKLLDNKKEKLPILLYFHAGGFCIESAFSIFSHRYISALTSQAKALIISVEYRLAPEHPLPAAYEDSWAALQWVGSHVTGESIHQEPWLIQHGNFDRVYVGGDSSGANIAHHLAMKGSCESLQGCFKIYGAILSHPFFWGSEPIRSEPILDREKGNMYKTWMFAYPCAPGGIDNPMINPFAENAPSLSGLGCSKLLVCVASEDELRERGVHYCDEVRESGWKGEIELFEMEGEGHIFHILGNPGTENAKKMISCLASFLRH